MIHQPILMLGLGWVLLVGLIVQVSSGSIALACIMILSPSIAVYFAYRLSKRSQTLIQKKIDDQNVTQKLVAEAAQKAVWEAQRAANASKATADATHKLVNGQKEQLEAEIAKRDERIAILEDRLGKTSP